MGAEGGDREELMRGLWKQRMKGNHRAQQHATTLPATAKRGEETRTNLLVPLAASNIFQQTELYFSTSQFLTLMWDHTTEPSEFQKNIMETNTEQVLPY